MLDNCIINGWGNIQLPIKKETRDLIVAQALQEVSFARQYKQGKIKNWKINENLYYGRKGGTAGTPSYDGTYPAGGEASRANVNLGQMSSFVHTLLSKIDNPLIFKYIKRKESQLQRVKLLNALRVSDQQKDDWDIKDIVGKKQAIIYGRAIYSYYADSYNGYCAHLDNVDVYDFLIDPSAGGIDIERAEYMGRYGVVKTKTQLRKGVKDKLYIKDVTENLIEGSSNATESSTEQTNKQNRTNDNNAWSAQKEISGSDKFKFWEWYTTYDGERYYLLLTETGSTAIRVEKLKDIFTSNLFPFWTWAAFPDLTEFWTPSFCDYVREIFMAQAVSINQMLDNAEQINKPQKVVNVGAIANLAELKYRRDGYIKVNKAFNVDQALQTIKVPSINTPIQVFNLLEALQEKNGGVTAGSKGVADEDKVGIYEGNQANAADRFGFLNKSYSFGYKRFSKLYEWGVKDNLIKKVSVDILGPEGVELVDVSRRDIFRSGEEFGCLVESSNAELALSDVEKRTKLTFLTNQMANPMQNPQKAYEIQASIAGFDEDTIRQLQDSGDFGDAKIMSEAERDIERLLDGEKVQPNQRANTAYKQKFVNYMRDHQEDISMDQFTTLAEYVLLLDPIIIRNMVQNANAILFKKEMEQINAEPVAPGGGPRVIDETKDININRENGASPETAPVETYGV